MKFEQMIDTYIQAFQEASDEPGQALVNRTKIRLLENIKDTLKGKVISIDTLETAVKEVEFETENGTPVVAISDLYETLMEAGVLCK